MADAGGDSAASLRRGVGVGSVRREPRPVSKMFNVEVIAEVAARSGILAHEVNKGAACNVCGDKCAGLDLHFWRKVCMNCKCPPSHHDMWEGSAPKIGRVVSPWITEIYGSKSSIKSRTVVKVGKLSMDLIKHLQGEMRLKGLDSLKEPAPDDLLGQERRARLVSLGHALKSGNAEEINIQEVTFAWEPVGISEEMVVQFFNSVPAIQVPVVGTSAEIDFRVRADTQMPPHDFDPDRCDGLTEAEKEEFGQMIKLKEKHHHVGQVVPVNESLTCKHCDETIPSNELGVEVKTARDLFTYHPKCFVCTTCDTLLVGLNAYVEKDRIYCGRHYNDLFKARCAACDESILEANFVKAEGKCWHTKHFCCSACDVNLAGKRYIPVEGQPHCVDCFSKRDTPVAKEVRFEEKDAPDEEIYLTTKLRGANTGTRIKTMASMKLKADHVPTDEAPRRKSQENPSQYASASKVSDQARPAHVPDDDEYEILWPKGQTPPPRKATAVASQFKGSVRRSPQKFVSTVVEEEEEDISALPGYFGKCSAQDAEHALKHVTTGTYLLRESVSSPGSYVLVIKLTEEKTVQLKIVEVNGCYAVPGTSRQFSTMAKLIAADVNCKQHATKVQSLARGASVRKVPQPFV